VEGNKKKGKIMIEPTGQQQINITAQQNMIDGLSKINFKGKSDDELMKAAQQFEAVFVNQLFKAMDSTIDREEGMLSGGRGEKMFRSMFYDEIAKDVTSNSTTSFGLAQQIYEQMKDKY